MTVAGCGAYWVARPKRNDNDDRYHLEVVTQPQLVAAAQLVAEETQATNAGMRTLAEKWIPGIVAITGILGLASVVVSKDSVEGLGQDWRIGAFALVAIAVLSAAVATALVYTAAFGWPKETALETDEQVLAAAQEISGRSRNIAASVRNAVVASAVSLVPSSQPNNRQSTNDARH